MLRWVEKRPTAPNAMGLSGRFLEQRGDAREGERRLATLRPLHTGEERGRRGRRARRSGRGSQPAFHRRDRGPARHWLDRAALPPTLCFRLDYRDSSSCRPSIDGPIRTMRFVPLQYRAERPRKWAFCHALDAFQPRAIFIALLSRGPLPLVPYTPAEENYHPSTSLPPS